jgi:hypothetical protein
LREHNVNVKVLTGIDSIENIWRNFFNLVPFTHIIS